MIWPFLLLGLNLLILWSLVWLLLYLEKINVLAAEVLTAGIGGSYAQVGSILGFFGALSGVIMCGFLILLFLISLLVVLYFVARVTPEAASWLYHHWFRPDHPIHMTVACIGLSIFLYAFRTNFKFWYGLVEVGCASISTWIAVNSLAHSTTAPLIACAPLVASCYFLVRGIDNVATGWPKSRPAKYIQLIREAHESRKPPAEETVSGLYDSLMKDPNRALATHPDLLAKRLTAMSQAVQKRKNSASPEEEGS
jgi:hypothetical protein